MKILDKNKLIFYIGDHHGDWENLFRVVNRIKLEHCYLISVGDSGIGFRRQTEQLENINNLNERFLKWFGMSTDTFYEKLFPYVKAVTAQYKK